MNIKIILVSILILINTSSYSNIIFKSCDINSNDNACAAFIPEMTFKLFEPTSSYATCFTPGQNCDQKIITMIKFAHNSIKMQAYGFTNALIINALIDAHKHGISVIIILDKSQVKREKHSLANYGLINGLQIFIDYKPAIAHNKIIIIDDKIIITGSFNFTNSAQKRNAENIIIINDKELTKLYLTNFLVSLKRSIDLLQYQNKMNR